jgi:hypothetical protein
MSFKPIRTFLSARLLAVDSNFEVFDNAFNSEQIGNNDFNKRYHIFYGEVASTSANNLTSDIVTSTVTLYFSGSRTSEEALDDAMDLSNLFRMECLKRESYSSLQFIKNVVCDSIRAEPIEASNDNAIKIVLTFRINMMFGIGANLDC